MEQASKKRVKNKRKQRRTKRIIITIIILFFLLAAIFGGTFYIIYKATHADVNLNITTYLENVDNDKFSKSLGNSYNEVVNTTLREYTYKPKKIEGFEFDSENKNNQRTIKKLQKDGSYKIVLYYKRSIIHLTVNCDGKKIDFHKKYGTPLKSILNDKAFNKLGYHPSGFLKSGTSQEVNLKDELITSNSEYTLVYTGNDNVSYEIRYLLDNLENDGYTNIDSETRKGVTGSDISVDVTNLVKIPWYAEIDRDKHPQNIVSTKLEYGDVTKIDVYLKRKKITYKEVLKKEALHVSEAYDTEDSIKYITYGDTPKEVPNIKGFLHRRSNVDKITKLGQEVVYYYERKSFDIKIYNNYQKLDLTSYEKEFDRQVNHKYGARLEYGDFISNRDGFSFNNTLTQNLFIDDKDNQELNIYYLRNKYNYTININIMNIYGYYDHYESITKQGYYEQKINFIYDNPAFQEGFTQILNDAYEVPSDNYLEFSINIKRNKYRVKLVSLLEKLSSGYVQEVNEYEDYFEKELDFSHLTKDGFNLVNNNLKYKITADEVQENTIKFNRKRYNYSIKILRENTEGGWDKIKEDSGLAPYESVFSITKNYSHLLTFGFYDADDATNISSRTLEYDDTTIELKLGRGRINYLLNIYRQDINGNLVKEFTQQKDDYYEKIINTNSYSFEGFTNTTASNEYKLLNNNLTINLRFDRNKYQVVFVKKIPKLNNPNTYTLKTITQEHYYGMIIKSTNEIFKEEGFTYNGTSFTHIVSHQEHNNKRELVYTRNKYTLIINILKEDLSGKYSIKTKETRELLYETNLVNLFSYKGFIYDSFYESDTVRAIENDEVALKFKRKKYVIARLNNYFQKINYNQVEYELHSSITNITLKYEEVLQNDKTKIDHSMRKGFIKHDGSYELTYTVNDSSNGAVINYYFSRKKYKLIIENYLEKDLFAQDSIDLNTYLIDNGIKYLHNGDNKPIGFPLVIDSNLLLYAKLEEVKNITFHTKSKFNDLYKKTEHNEYYKQFEYQNILGFSTKTIKKALNNPIFSATNGFINENLDIVDSTSTTNKFRTKYNDFLGFANSKGELVFKATNHPTQGKVLAAQSLAKFLSLTDKNIDLYPVFSMKDYVDPTNHENLKRGYLFFDGSGNYLKKDVEYHFTYIYQNFRMPDDDEFLDKFNSGEINYNYSLALLRQYDLTFTYGISLFLSKAKKVFIDENLNDTKFESLFNYDNKNTKYINDINWDVHVSCKKYVYNRYYFYRNEKNQKHLLYYNLSQIKKDGGRIIIPPEITSIGAFFYKDNVLTTNLVIPNNVNELTNSFIYNYQYIKQVKLSDNIKTIPNSAFYECRNIDYVVLPKNLTSIEDAAFKNTKIKQIRLPENTKYIAGSAFEETKMTYFFIGKNNSEINHFYPFASNISNQLNLPTYLMNILTIHPENKNNKKLASGLYSYDLKRLIYCFPKNGVYNMLDSIEEIKSCAIYSYYEYNKLKSHLRINIPQNQKLKTIRSRAILIYSDGTPQYFIYEINIPDSVETFEYDAIKTKLLIKRLKISNNIKEINFKLYYDKLLNTNNSNNKYFNFFNNAIYAKDYKTLYLGTLYNIDKSINPGNVYKFHPSCTNVLYLTAPQKNYLNNTILKVPANISINLSNILGDKLFYVKILYLTNNTEHSSWKGSFGRYCSVLMVKSNLLTNENLMRDFIRDIDKVVIASSLSAELRNKWITLATSNGKAYEIKNF